MLIYQAAVLCFVGAVASDLVFPADFKFGAATSSYQVEGAWNVSDKGESIWDRFTHSKRQHILDQSDGDQACKSYHFWRKDVDIVSDLGLDFYRLSISWSRLLPSGFPSKVSSDGLRYYNDLIDSLLERGVQPMVTLYHWELPQRLQDLGGWTNSYVTDWFADYARFVFSQFADRVHIWLTFNEPIVACQMAYMGILAPGVNDSSVGSYLCDKNVLVAHAKAWRIYDEEFRPKHRGKIGITNQLFWMESDEVESQELVDLMMQYHGGIFLHPVLSKEGGWPPLIEKIMAEKSMNERYDFSRLPPFTEEEKKLVKGTTDFIGVNFYTSRVPRKARPEDSESIWNTVSEFGMALDVKSEWKHGGIEWLYSYPEGLRKLLVWLKEQYGDQEIMITENGYPEPVRNLDDDDRIEFLKTHLEQILLAIKEDGVRVIGYTVWSLMDNFEWNSGYAVKFGIYDVDFTDPMRKRTPKKSARYYANVIRSRSPHAAHSKL